METEGSAQTAETATEQAVLPEIEAFSFLLVITLLIDSSLYNQASLLTAAHQ